MARRRHLKAAGLSEAARAIIVAAFEAGTATYEEIAAAVLTQTGEQIGRSSVARYYPCWCEAQLAKKIELAAAERARAMIALPTAELEQALETLEVGRLYESLAEAQTPITPAQALVARDRAARRKQKDRELNIEERRMELLERKLAAFEAKAAAANKQVSDLVASRELTPEAAQKILEIYGIAGDS